MTDRTGRLDPVAMSKRVAELGMKMAETKAAASMMEHNAKALEASVALEAMSQGASAAKAGLMSKADERVTAKVAEYIEMQQQADEAKTNHQAAIIYCELVRSVESSRRAEMKLT